MLSEQWILWLESGNVCKGWMNVCSKVSVFLYSIKVCKASHSFFPKLPWPIFSKYSKAFPYFSFLGSPASWWRAYSSTEGKPLGVIFTGGIPNPFTAISILIFPLSGSLLSTLNTLVSVNSVIFYLLGGSLMLSSKLESYNYLNSGSIYFSGTFFYWLFYWGFTM